MGYGQTVTYGVISAVDRTLEMDDGTVSKGLIQTDAAINPGNSGGALLNVAGEVIGISSSKIGGATVDGVGFAIPITSAEPILSDIVERVERNKVAESKQGYLGIGGQTVTEEVSNMYGLPVGVLVRQVYEGTGAAESGLQQGDVITEVGGSRIKSMEDLREELQYYAKDDVVEVTVSRLDGGLYSDITLEVRLVDKKALD
ncbi:MAG: PDZ domain-containing protein [Lachnospiraceae bacterium]|nr:PDZ domain-containing protein [Lachnospiraceae bacterium]